ncbi:uncharacterized protein [Melanerpes formicivorus]|uniref:uncharacterized protein n=1 Tax=Melanerpes formicivorus TaxID=211600 RepID=UPI0035901089
MGVRIYLAVGSFFVGVFLRHLYEIKRMIIPSLALMLSVLIKVTPTLRRAHSGFPLPHSTDHSGCRKCEDFAAFKAKRGGKHTSAGAAARAMPAAASGHRRAEEEMPGVAGLCPPFAHSRRESEGEKIAPDQAAKHWFSKTVVFRRLHADVINLGAEIAGRREKEIIYFARKRFPDAARERPPPRAEQFISVKKTQHNFTLATQPRLLRPSVMC